MKTLKIKTRFRAVDYASKRIKRMIAKIEYILYSEQKAKYRHMWE